MVVREFGMLFVAVAVWVGQFTSSNNDATVLATGDAAARYEAATRILATPADQRSEAVWQALRSEVERLVRCGDVPPPPPPEWNRLKCETGVGRESEYLPTLIEALSQTTDPAMIPTLIKVAPSGAIAISGLMKFDDVAVPLLIESALSSRSGPWVTEADGAMFALAKVVEGGRISAESRLQVTDTARELLNDRLTDANWIAVVNLALATADTDLRARVERLANDASELRRHDLADDHIEQIQRGIRFQLSRHPKP